MGDVDRKKHDVDVIERVLGGVYEQPGPDDRSRSLLDVDVPWFGGSKRSTVEMTVGLPAEARRSPRSNTDRDR
jgi:hypothetical protein